MCAILPALVLATLDNGSLFTEVRPDLAAVFGFLSNTVRCFAIAFLRAGNKIVNE